MPDLTLREIYLRDTGREARDFSQTREVNGQNIDVSAHSPITRVERFDMEEQARENAPSLWENINNSFQADTSIGAIGRLSERNRDEFDPDWSLTDEEKKEVFGFYSNRESEYLLSSSSQNEFNLRKQDIEEDRERENRLAEAGYSGLGVRLAVSMLDPANIVLGLATGGLATSARLTRLANAVRVGSITAAENVALDALITTSDTQRDWSDLFLSATAGFAVGGGIGALRRVKGFEDPKQGNLIDNLDDIDSSLTRAANDIDIERLSERLEILPDIDRIDKAIISRSVALVEDARRLVKSPKTIKKYEKKYREGSSEIKQLQRMRDKEVADVWSQSGIKKSDRVKAGKKAKVARLQAETKIDKILSKYDALILSKVDKMSKLQSKLDNNVKAISAQKDLLKWDSMSRDEQIKSLFKDEMPIVKRKRATAIKKAKETKAKRLDEAAKPTKKESEDTPEGSVGAMKTREDRLNNRFFSRTLEEEDTFIEDAIERTENFEESVGRNYVKGIPDIFLGDYSILTQSEDIGIRALANEFLANPQTGQYGETVSHMVRLFDAEIRKAGAASIDRGYDEYLQDLKINKVQGYVSSAIREQFDSKVSLAVKGLLNTTQLPRGVKTAADGVKEQLKKAGELRQQYGELGFEKLELGDNYLPDIMSREGLASLSYELGWGKQDIMELIAKGYKNGDNDLSDAQSRLMAFIKYNSWTKGELYDGDVHSIYRANSATEAKQLLEKAKVPEELIKSFMNEVDEANDWATVSKRARKSLKIDWNSSHTVDGRTVRISDIMNTNVSQLVEAYTKESAYGAALARKGIKSEGMRNRIFLQVKEQAKDSLGTGSTSEKEEIDKIFTRFDKAITMLQGRPLVDYSESTNRAGRMVLDLTAVLRLQQAGFASIGDLARTIQSAGIADTIRAVPGASILRNPFNRYQGRSLADFKAVNEEMAEIEDMLGFFEEDNFHMSFTSRSEEFGSDARSRLGKSIENSIEGTKRISQWMNLFNTVQGSISKISARAINRKLIADALGSKKLTKGMKQQLLDTGMSESDWNKISKWVKENHTTTNRDSRKLPLWNFEEMPSEYKIKLQLSMSKLHTRHVQRGLIGETNSDWFGPYARFITQFKSHSLISMEKQLVHDMRGDKARMAGVTLWGTGLAYFAYMSQIQLRALGMAQDKRDKYIEDNTTGQALAWGVMNKHSQLAMTGLVADLGVLSGAMPKEYYDTTRYGYQHGQLDSLIPAMGTVQDGLKLSGNVFDLAYSPLRGDVNESTEQLGKSALRLLPLTNTIYLGEYIKNAADLK